MLQISRPPALDSSAHRPDSLARQAGHAALRCGLILALLAAACGDEGATDPLEDQGLSADAGITPDGATFPDGSSTDQGASSTDGPRTDGPKPDGSKPKTDAAAGPSFSFAVFGDNQFATTSCTSGTTERLAVPKAILAAAPTLVLHTGDLMDHGYETGAYAKLVSCYSGMLAKLPFFPTAGNHDLGSDGVYKYRTYLETQLLTRNPQVWGTGYKSAFTVSYKDDTTAYSESFSSPKYTSIVPSGVSFKTFYAVKFKNAYFISFEQGTRWWMNTPKTWLEKHLKAARADSSIQHVFVYLHHPLYSTTMDESSSGESVGPVRTQYEPLFRQYDVTAVFSGHAHLYEHFHVPDSGATTRSSTPPSSYTHDGKSVHYIVTGGGGGGLNGCGLKQEKSYNYSQKRGCFYHFTRVQVAGKKLTVSIVKVTGSDTKYTTQVFDSFTLQ